MEARSSAPSLPLNLTLTVVFLASYLVVAAVFVDAFTVTTTTKTATTTATGLTGKEHAAQRWWLASTAGIDGRSRLGSSVGAGDGTSTTKTAEQQTTAEKSASGNNSQNMFFASTIQQQEDRRSPTTTQPKQQQKQQQQEQRRVLGSQELLMLPRQYGPGLPGTKFPQMNHVSCHVVSSTPSVSALKSVVDDAIRSHPLLRAHVEGTGEPEERIDLFKMVRKGEPDPLVFVAPPEDDVAAIGYTADDVVTVVDVVAPPSGGSSNLREILDASWQTSFRLNLDDGSWCNVDKGPLWKVELHRVVDGKDGGDTESDKPCAIMLSFNHAISDQSSANRLMDQILRELAELEAGTNNNNSPSFRRAASQKMPVALEDSVMGDKQRWSDVETGGVSLATIKYVAGKAAEGLKNPVILPDAGAEGIRSKSDVLRSLSVISGRASGGEDTEKDARKSTVEFRTLSKSLTDQLLKQCRANGVSISHALTAAVTLTCTDFVGSRDDHKRNYKVLQSLDMRRFGAQLDQAETVACMAGSMDLMHGPFADQSGRAIRQNPTKERLSAFWKLAQEGRQQTEAFVDSGGPVQATRVFDFAMTISDLNNLVYVTSQSKDTKGRAYSAGVTNVGVYERQAGFRVETETDRKPLRTHHGRYKVEDVFFATPHTQSGCLYPVSCLTVNGEMKLTLNPVSPIVDEIENSQFADALIDLLKSVATGEATLSSDVIETGDTGLLSSIPKNLLPMIAAIGGSIAVATHAGAWASFFQSVMEMKQNVDNPADFWAALNFWIFFAVGHPILRPILWISDVLHGSPGPLVGGLVPVSFIAGNILVIGALAMSKQVS